MRTSDPRRGMVLVVVLWTIALCAGLAMVASTTFRGFAGIVAVDRDRIRGEALLTAGLEAAGGLLAAAQDQTVDGVDTAVTLPAGSVRARLRDEGGRIDIGRAPVEVLVSLLHFVGAPAAQDLARDIVAWRESGAPSRPNGAAPPAVQQSSDNQPAPFTDVRLLRRVRGIGPQLVAALLPLTTVFGSETVNPMTASQDVLAALPNMDRERAAAIVDTRRRFPADPGRLTGLLGPVQKYAQVKAQRAVSVALAARLVNGYRAAAEAVIIHLPDDSEPYRVLAWSPLPRS